MVSEYQVPPSGIPARLVEMAPQLLLLRNGIEAAWRHTRQQVAEAGYGDLVQWAAFGQLLNVNIMHHIHLVANGDPCITVGHRKNRRNTALHAVAWVHGVRLTVSAVEMGQFPRLACFRVAYARQGEFDIGPDHAFRIVPLEGGASWQYVQVLHGPTPGDRYHLGFVELALISADGTCRGRINIDDVIAPSDGRYVPADVEDIGDQIETPMKPRVVDIYAEC